MLANRRGGLQAFSCRGPRQTG